MRTTPSIATPVSEAATRSGLSRREFMRTAAAGTGALIVAPTLWRRPAIAGAPPAEGLHLAFGADPRTSMGISWFTEGVVGSPVVDIGPTDDYGITLPAQTRVVNATPPAYPGSPSNYHHATVHGLEPDTEYRYRVRHGGGPATTGRFRTAPAAAEPFRFTAFGDQGVGSGARATTGLVKDLDAALQFHVGDLCYAHTVIGIGLVGPTDQAVWDDWFRMISAQAAGAPWMTTVGNHEMEPGHGELGYEGYHARFNNPSAPTTYYSFRYGNVAFVSLDANDASYQIPKNRGYTSYDMIGNRYRQDDWLRATLHDLRADPEVDFIVVGFHHCAYCTNAVHGSDGGVRDRWTPMFDEFEVDLVVNGHNHCYERTHPIRAGSMTREAPPGAIVDPATDGTVYVTAGGGGQQPYPISTSPVGFVHVIGGARVPEEAPWSAVRAFDISLLVADVEPPDNEGVTTMHLRALRSNGEPIMAGAAAEELTLRRTRSAS